ncbi:MAG TPA: NADH-quinone oxidoreductase subunit NuoK [Thermoanaerobaculia bacterium]
MLESAPSTAAYLMLSATLFTVGLIGVVIRRNMITVLMSIELMLNAVNINLIAFSYRLSSLEGQIFVIFVIAVAAGEAAVGLAIIIQLYRLRSTINVDEARTLNG